MKQIIILLLSIPFFSFQTETDNNLLIGRWMGEDQGQIGYIYFDHEGYAAVEIQGEKLGGKEFIYNGRKAKMTYVVNSGSTPLEIDLILTNLETGEQNKLLCIASFVDDNTMKFAMDFGQNMRPVEFTSHNSITLKREK